jgi:hypothetical protein
MTEPDNHTLALLHEIRDEQKAQRSIVEDHGRKLDTLTAKVEKMNVEPIGVRGRVRKIEEALEDVANVLQRHGVV